MSISNSTHQLKFTRQLIGNPQLEVWHSRIDMTPPIGEAALDCLSDLDRVRYERLVMLDAKREFLGSRLMLSALIEASKIAPKNRDITYAKNGKPAFAANSTTSLSWSRSMGELVLAISTHGEVGIDIEVRRDISYGAMLNMICDKEELAEFNALDDTQKRDGFFRLWTLKEAVLKCIGTGFQTSAKSIRIPQSVYAQKTLEPFNLDCLKSQFELRQFESGHAVIALASLRA